MRFIESICTCRRGQGTILTAALAAALLLGTPQASASVVSGTVHWDVVHAASGSVVLFGQIPNPDSTFPQATVPIAIAADGLSGTYIADLPANQYSIEWVVGDCANAADGTCANGLVVHSITPVTVGDGEPVVFDLSTPPDFGAAIVTGTATLVGGVVTGGNATFNYNTNFSDEVSVSGYAIVALDGAGHYEASIGSGSVSVSVVVTQAQCVLPQFLFASSFVSPGVPLLLDVSGVALPLATQGKIEAQFGVTGFPGALFSIDGFSIAPVPDCNGAGNGDPFAHDVLAGDVFLSNPSGSNDISVGNYQLSSGFTASPAVGVSLTYKNPTSHAAVSSGQTTVIDLRMNPQLVLGHPQIDWAQLGPLTSAGPVEFNAFADPVPGDSVVAEARWEVSGDFTGVHTYDFSLPLDPALNWHFEGAFFPLSFADGTFQVIFAVPGASSADVTVPVPHMGAGQSLTYDFGDLLRFGVGHVQFAPRGMSFGSLNGNAIEVVASGARESIMFKSGIFGEPHVTATVMQGQQALTGTWYDADFNVFTADLLLNVAARETVVLTDSPPALDVSQPQSDATICAERITVTGTASDPDGLAAVTVNNKSVTVNKKTGAFSIKIDVPKGDSDLVVAATDSLGHSITRVRPLHRPRCGK